MTKNELAKEIFSIVDNGILIEHSKEDIITEIETLLETLTPINKNKFAAWGQPHQISTPKDCWPTKKQLFTIPIGDWSDDGHGECEYFLVESNRPLEEVREAFFNTSEKCNKPFDINYQNNYNGICCDPEDNKIEDWQIEKLQLPFDKYKHLFDEDGIYEPTTQEFCQLIVDWLNYHNPELEITLIGEDNKGGYNMLPFYGYDNQKRHINFFGYGLFLM